MGAVADMPLVRIDALLGRTYPLTAVNEAYAALTGGAVGRAVAVPGQ